MKLLQVTRLAAVISLMLPSACVHLRAPRPVQPYRPFPPFLDEIRNAQPGQFVGKPGNKVESATAFEEMRQHILDLYAGITVRNSFVGPDRMIVDCIPIEQQPGLRRPGVALQLRGPAVSADPVTSGGASGPAGRKQVFLNLALQPGRRDRFGQEMYCQPGTVPLRRITLVEMTRFLNLAAFLSKGSTARLPGGADGADHYYAVGTQDVTNIGANSIINVWRPSVADSQESISQQWIFGGSGDDTQTIEAGWQVLPGKWKVAEPVFFIYHTTQNYKNGSGCYNAECKAWVQVANDLAPGAAFSSVSKRDGDQKIFRLQWQLFASNWWLLYQAGGDWKAIGYFPSSIYGQGRLATSGAGVDFGGEVTGLPSALEMGSGKKASEGYRRTAYQRTIYYIDTNRNGQWADLGKFESNPECYTIDIKNRAAQPWGSYIFFGGPKCK